MNQPVLWSVDPSADLLVSSLDYIETRLLKVVNVFKLCLYHVPHENDISPFTNLTLNTSLVMCSFIRPNRLVLTSRYLVLSVSCICLFQLFFISFCFRARENILISYINIWRFMEPFSEFRYVLLGLSSPASITNIELIL